MSDDNIFNGYINKNIKSDKENYIKEMNKILLQDVDTIASNNIESIDRVTPSYYYIEIKAWKRFFLFGYYKWKYQELKWWYWRKRGKVETIQMDVNDKWLGYNNE